MLRRKRRDWVRLDNAAKIFASSSHGRDNNVFRFACVLREEIDPECLQAALDRTMERFPLYRAVLKRGLFWYYLEQSDLRPITVKENRPPCSNLYNKDVRSLLFELTYYHNRINLEVFHALSDGTGALNFLRTVVVLYLSIKHPHLLPGELPWLDYDASFTQMREDSFEKYYEPKQLRRKGAPRAPKTPKAFSLRGHHIPENRIGILQGTMSVSAVLALSKAAGVSLTEYLSALLLVSIRNEMPARFAAQPVVLSVPVNLRKYYPSESARNFFGLIFVDYFFTSASETVEEVARGLHAGFREKLKPEVLSRRMNRLIALERNPAIRAIPLVVKDIALRIGKDWSTRSSTCTISNVGRVEMPENVQPYIEGFEVFNSTDRLQACLCSFGDRLSISFTSGFISTEIQKNFFRGLTSRGVGVEISSNLPG